MFEGRAILRKHEEETKHKRGVAGKKLSVVRVGNDRLSKPRLGWYCWAKNWQINPISQWWRRVSTVAFSRQEETLCQLGGDEGKLDPLPYNDQFGRGFLLYKKASQSNLSDDRFLDSDSTPKRMEVNKPEFEQWPHVTRFKNWKTSFRREVITGSPRPRQPTDWLTELDLGKINARFGQRRICTRQHQDEFWNPGFPNCEGPHENQVFIIQKANFRWPRIASKKKTPDVEARLHDLRLEDQQSSQDSHNHKWLGINILKHTRRSQKEVFWKALYHRQLEKSTLMQNALALYHSDQVQQPRVEEILEVAGYGPRRFGRPAAKFFCSSRRKTSRKKIEQLQWHQWKKTKVTGNEEIANSGHPEARAQETQNARSSTKTKVEEREEETSECGRQVRQKRQPTPKIEVSNQTAQVTSGKECRPPYFSYKKGRSLKAKMQLLASSILRFSQKNDKAGQIRIGPKDDCPSSPTRPQQSN